MKPGARFELPATDVVFSQDARARVGELFDSSARRSDAEVFFTGWDAPRLDEGVLRQAPRLRAVFHAAGSVRGIVTPEFWERDIVICSAWRINARPVSEFVLAQIIFALKHAPFRSRRMHVGRTKPGGFDSPGASGSTVGLVGLGAIGRGVLQLLRSLDVRVVAFDPVRSGVNACAWAMPWWTRRGATCAANRCSTGSHGSEPRL